MPTVERAVRTGFFCSSAMAGRMCSIRSTSGRSSRSRNMRAYVERDSMYLHCPSAKRVSNARDDLPEPETPVMTVSRSWGMSTETFFDAEPPRLGHSITPPEMESLLDGPGAFNSRRPAIMTRSRLTASTGLGILRNRNENHS